MQCVEYRYSQRLQATGHRSLFATTLWFAHREDDCSMIGHYGRVEDENGIRMLRLQFVVINYFGPRLSQQSNKVIMLLPCRWQIRTAPIVPCLRVIDGKCLIRALYQHFM